MEYFRIGLALLGVLWCIFKIISKKNVINIKEVYPTKREFMKKHMKKVDIILRIFLTLVVIVYIFFALIPTIKDFNGYINKKYVKADCVVTFGNSEKEGWNIRRHVNLQNVSTGEIISLDISSKELYKGDYCTIEYLPNIKIGKVTSINKGE